MLQVTRQFCAGGAPIQSDRLPLNLWMNRVICPKDGDANPLLPAEFACQPDKIKRLEGRRAGCGIQHDFLGSDKVCQARSGS
jgi:hypothetical protein